MIPIEIPRPIENLSPNNLNGWWRDRIVVSNNPDPRIGDFDFESTVFRNWPSQRSRKYPHGFIGFNNGRRLRYTARQTIDGRFLFHYGEVKIYWELHLERMRLREAFNVLKDDDFFAAAELLVQLVAPTFVVDRLRMSRSWVEGEVALHLPAVGLRQLRDLVSLLTLAAPERQALNVAA